MIIDSMNIRGLGVKKKKIKDLIRSNKLEFLAIQETKLETVDGSLSEYLWGDASCEWEFSPSIGRFGGMLCIWNKESFRLLFSFKGGGFCGGLW